MSRYAAGTRVATDRTQAEIQTTIRRYGADDIITGQSAEAARAFVQFRYRGFSARVMIPLPDPKERRFWVTPSGKFEREADVARAEWEKATRQQWRVLLLLLKAQFEAIENNVITAEEAFLPWILMPGGRTIGQEVLPQLQAAADGGQLKALPFGRSEG